VAGAMRKMGVYLGLVEDDDEAGVDGRTSYDGYDRAARNGDYARPDAKIPAREWSEAEPNGASEYGDAEYPSSPSYRITTLHPRTYNEARTIGEHFRSATPVIMNLSEMDDADAKRLVDFAAGLTFGLHGRIERVTAKVFLLSPNNVTVTAADKARIAEGGFFNQS
jgi:cell division inhibitor SepF